MQRPYGNAYSAYSWRWSCSFSKQGAFEMEISSVITFIKSSLMCSAILDILLRIPACMSLMFSHRTFLKNKRLLKFFR